jgi:hypothetical protein
MVRLALLAVACIVLTACGASQTQPLAQDAPGVAVEVTIDWGARELANGEGRPGTVIAATRSVVSLQTSYGGRYVDAIADQRGNGREDWVFWVNGIESAVGGADLKVQPGDAIWWDRHRWEGRVHVPAVIGSWPRPLTRGIAGPTVGVSADPPLATALRAAGADVTIPAATTGPRAVVDGAAELLERDPGWRRAMADPGTSGLTAWIGQDGVYVWDAGRNRPVMVPTAVAVVVATTDGFSASDPPIFAVVGVTAAAARAAAQMIVQQPDLLRRTASICLDPEGVVVCRGGIGRTS